MNIQQFISFQKAAELESFSKTAEVLNYSQSAITIQIQSLEEEFGTPLFNRVGKTISLTPAGERLLTHVNEILHKINETYEDITKAPISSGNIRVGCIDSLCTCHLPKVLKSFHKIHPHCSVSITTSSPQEILDKMNHNEIDIAYILDTPIYHKQWNKELEDRMSINFVCSSKSPLAEKPIINIEDLLNYPFYLTEEKDNYRFALEQKLASMDIEINTLLEVPSTDVIISLIIENNGVSFLPQIALLEGIQEGLLTVLNVKGFSLDMYRQIFVHKNKWISQEMKDFIELTRDI